MRKGRRGGQKAEKISIIIIVLALLVALSVQIYRLKQKDEAYSKQEEELLQQYAEETERAVELGELEAYIQTTQYIEDIANSKLGLAYDNEIIFKESDE